MNAVSRERVPYCLPSILVVNVVGFSSVNDTLEIVVSTGRDSNAIKRLSMSAITGWNFSFSFCMSW